ncbi:DUF6883 domain-containing protein [Desulforhabdus amnigena]|jgi:hypothetical protein|uniref:DUF6883 domain-containing protein n=1 Tax=Desulforhabdus amnigena TaxID=40218 RepID=A0A9W6LA25_9BACT|nr:DUF6883 domain-containing protein [Desulforhabdus amnigena]NLJ29928.1 hypothetical protein [Deltaproteobacteria bacterium]GLI35536.1 hypothetical protein DAMNIGENAA_29690 [Desulforhabdus amnigena]
MKLPRNREAIVPERKITEYLLSESHPVGKAKARYFRALGYSERNASQLKEDLTAIAVTYEVTEMIDTPFGRKYVVDGALATPGGIKARVRTVWIVEAGEDISRFVTAYPREEENRGVESD